MTGHRRSPRVALTLVVIAALSLLGFAVAPAAVADEWHYVPGTALINADSVTTGGGLTDANGQPISVEAYIAEKAGFTPTVVSGSTWDSMTPGQFSSYQLLIVGDPGCGTTPTSVTSNATVWAPAVRAMAGANGSAGNRVVLGTDPESALLHGGGAAQPSGPPGPNLSPPEPIDPLLSGSGRLMERMMQYAGAAYDATGLYFDTSCHDNGGDVAVLNQLSRAGTGFTSNANPPCGATVAQAGLVPSPYATQPDSDLQGWGCSATMSFPTYPPDFHPLAIATDTTTSPTCGIDQTTSANACGEAYVLAAGQGVVTAGPDITLTPTSSSSPERGTQPVTATVTHQGTPVAGQSVAFAVGGVDDIRPAGPGTCMPASCTTDANGNVTYTYRNFGPGADTIYASTTLNGSTEQATAAQMWTGPNILPTADSASANVQLNTPTPITLQASDSTGNPLNSGHYILLNSPAHGTLSGTAPILTYTPTTGYLGPDSFQFYVINGPVVYSNAATISITVTSNPVPVADSASDNVVLNTPIPITLQASESNGDPLTYTVLSQPTHGTLSGTAPNLTYTAAAGYVGPDSLTFMAADGQFDSNVATISINVMNPAPLADSASASAEQNTPTPITLQASDSNGDPLTYAVSSPPTHGTLSGTAPNLTYTPAVGYLGPDSLTFTAADGSAQSNVATISITVVGCPRTAPTLDTTVSADQQTPASKFTSPAITTAGGNELLLAFVEADGPLNPTQTITSVTGGGLQWTLAGRTNATLGTSEVWRAFATAPLSAVTISATLNNRSFDGSITVSAFHGAGSTVGTVATNAATSGAPTVTLTPSTCGSLIWAAGHDWTNDTVPVAAGGQAIVHQFIDTNAGDSFWAQDTTTPTQPNTTVTIADSGPTTDRWGLAAVEIRPAG
ncbi:MAG TPA: Ig-like domain-containing protein [Pseudonocardiaceae bacterium]